MREMSLSKTIFPGHFKLQMEAEESHGDSEGLDKEVAGELW